MVYEFIKYLVFPKERRRFINYLLLKFSNKFELSHFYGQPIYVQIETTTYCNYKCFMCGGSREKKKHMSFQNFKKIITKIPYCIIIELHGVGEPLLNPDLIKIIQLCKKREIITGFTTNATILSEELGKKLILAGLDSIDISIDGATAKTFKSMRGKGFHTVIKNVKRFTNLKKVLKSKTPRIGAKVRVAKENLHEIPRLLNLLKNIGIERVSLMELRRGLKNTPAFDKKQLSLLMKHFAYGQSIGLDVQLGFRGSPMYRKMKKMRCIRFWKGVYITINGWVTPCCRVTSEKMFTFGNILNQNFLDIWNGQEYKHIRMLLKNGYIPELCKNCTINGIPWLIPNILKNIANKKEKPIDFKE